MQEAKDVRSIDDRTKILPHITSLEIPEFHKHNRSVKTNVLCFEETDCEEWFRSFVEDISSKIGKEYYPIMRMSDGEYAFLLGKKYPYIAGNNLFEFFNQVFRVLIKRISFSKSFHAATLPNVSSGSYHLKEIENNYSHIVRCIRKIAKRGVLALHLTFSQKPFQEKYHLPLKKWLKECKIPFNANNYYPFYFVYALMRGSCKRNVLKDNTIIVFHSATGNKRKNIIDSLKKENVKEVIWHQISSSRSMFDEIEILDKYMKADIALVGAGVGKFNILAQLEPLEIPCIDIGFVFEVWANESNKWKRPIMVPDSEWDPKKIKF